MYVCLHSQFNAHQPHTGSFFNIVQKLIKSFLAFIWVKFHLFVLNYFMNVCLCDWQLKNHHPLVIKFYIDVTWQKKGYYIFGQNLPIFDHSVPIQCNVKRKHNLCALIVYFKNQSSNFYQSLKTLWHCQFLCYPR